MDLSTRYLGLNLRNPLVASASPLASSVDGVRRLAGAGVAAVVLPSLFEEELRRQAAQNAGAGASRDRQLRRVAVLLPRQRPAPSRARAST